MGMCGAGFIYDETKDATYCASRICDVAQAWPAASWVDVQDKANCCVGLGCTGATITAPANAVMLSAHKVTGAAIPDPLNSGTDVQDYLACKAGFYRSDSGPAYGLCSNAGAFALTVPQGFTCSPVATCFDKDLSGS